MTSLKPNSGWKSAPFKETMALDCILGSTLNNTSLQE